jgi:hypothetical protein
VNPIALVFFSSSFRFGGKGVGVQGTGENGAAFAVPPVWVGAQYGDGFIAMSPLFISSVLPKIRLRGVFAPVDILGVYRRRTRSSRRDANPGMK